MKEQNPRSIKSIGILVTILSGLIIVSNGMGAFVWSTFGMSGGMSNQNVESYDPLSFVFSHYIEMCLGMLLIGTAFLIGGVFIQKCKLWANRMVSGLSLLLILMIWGLMISMSIAIGKEEGMEIFSYGALLNALFWTIPFGLLIWFLNKEGVKKHFS